MHRINTKVIITIILISIYLFLGLVFFKSVFQYLADYLSKTERINANILLIEGWLPQENIELAYHEFQKNGYEHIITTGLKNPEYYIVPMKGYLIFFLKNKLTGVNKIARHYIEVNAYSELEGENCAHFNLFINDSLVADFLVDKKKRKYGISWEGSLPDIDSILVQFDNDRVGEFGDRNLFVKEIIINHKITIPYQNNSEYDISLLDGKKRFINNYDSYAELAENRLISMGIDSSFIIAVPSERVRINRTLTSALAFRNWLEKSDCKVRGINIITLGTHAQRTQMTYYKVLNKSFDIGIISLPDYRTHYSRKYKVLKTLRETIGIIYYWFILIPY